jgi:predicted transcriptional regulator
VADAEVEAGRFVTHDKVAEWLKSWGAPDELPCPKPERR